MILKNSSVEINEIAIFTKSSITFKVPVNMEDTLNVTGDTTMQNANIVKESKLQNEAVTSKLINEHVHMVIKEGKDTEKPKL